MNQTGQNAGKSAATIGRKNAKKGGQKHAKKQSEHSIELQVPSPEDWRELMRNLKLSKNQETNLAFVLEEASADIKTYQDIVKNRPKRSDLVTRLGKLESRLRRLRNEIGRDSHVLRDIVPLKALETLGALFTFSAISRAINKEAFPVRFNADMDYLRRNNQSVGLKEIEKFYESKRSDYGLTHAPALLLHVIDLIHKPIEEWMELNRRNKGGSPPKAIRRFLIEKLAEAAPLIIGKPAPIAVSGDFVALCEQVLPACGLSAEGVGKAVPTIVRKIRAKTGKRSESKGGSM